MTDPQSIRRALTRKALAATRHRAAAGRMLGLSENEVLAVQHLALAGRLTPSALRARGGLPRGAPRGGVGPGGGPPPARGQRREPPGHVTRESHPHDGRSTLLRLT